MSTAAPHHYHRTRVPPQRAAKNSYRCHFRPRSAKIGLHYGWKQGRVGQMQILCIWVLHIYIFLALGNNSQGLRVILTRVRWLYRNWWNVVWIRNQNRRGGRKRRYIYLFIIDHYIQFSKPEEFVVFACAACDLVSTNFTYQNRSERIDVSLHASNPRSFDKHTRNPQFKHHLSILKHHTGQDPEV